MNFLKEKLYGQTKNNVHFNGMDQFSDDHWMILLKQLHRPVSDAVHHPIWGNVIGEINEIT